MGDGSGAAQLIGMAQRAGQGDEGFSALWRGTPEMGLARVFDSGYPFMDRNSVATARRLGNPLVLEQCRQVTCRVLKPAFYRMQNKLILFVIKDQAVRFIDKNQFFPNGSRTSNNVPPT